MFTKSNILKDLLLTKKKNGSAKSSNLRAILLNIFSSVWEQQQVSM